jgi:hypothetical protein
MGPGLRSARRWACHFGGQPVHIPKVGQNSLELDPAAFCRDEALEGVTHQFQPSPQDAPTRALLRLWGCKAPALRG